MNVPLIEVDKAEAERRLKAYEESLARTRDEESEAVARGYRALAEGEPVLHLSQAIQSGGLFPDGRPKLAVGRADRRQVEFRWMGGGRMQFSTLHHSISDWAYTGSLLLAFDGSGMERPERVWRGYSLIPMVPPKALKACGGRSRLREHFTLWEVDEWSDLPFRARPPEDPLLLRPIGGELYAVVAAWDLTELERAVMAGRREA